MQPADHEVHLVGQSDAGALRLDELTCRHERFQEPAKRRPFFLRNPERFDQLARGSGMRDLVTHQRQYLFAGKHFS
jgi:hypothetical protein